MTSSPEPFRLVLAGQSLIERPLVATPSSASIRDVVRASDLAVTNLEAAISAPGGWPVRDMTSHVAPEGVLDTLEWFGFSAVALASNHAFDLGPPGIVAALEATRRRGMLAAGTGHDADSAARPGFAEFAGRRVGLVGIVAAANPPGAHALNARDGLPARPGVNRLRVNEALDAPHGADAEPDHGDVDALVKSVRSAAAAADFVVVYLHNHYWANPQHATPTWVRALAKRCVEAGASTFLGHGTPVTQGFELYQGHLLAYGLGSFVFHTRKPDRYDIHAWESALVEVDLAPDGTALDVRVRPTIHGAHADLRGQGDGAPVFATPDRAREIVVRLDELSRRLGACVTTGGDGLARVAPLR